MAFNWKRLPQVTTFSGAVYPVVHLELSEVNLTEVNDVCISGLYNYHKVEHLAAFDYIYPDSFPENKLK